MSDNKKESKRKAELKELDPCWDPGEYVVEGVNKDTDILSESLGISEERNLELRIMVTKSIIKHKNIHKTMIETSEECCHPNELALVNYLIGNDVALLKHGNGFAEFMEKQLVKMEKELNALRNGEAAPADDDDEELTFPEEPEEKEEPLVFDED
jgi:hypothetical protein